LVLKSEVFCMSLLLSLFLTGGLEVMLAAPDPASAQSPAPATKKNRRSSRKSLPKTPPPEMPPMEDLPLGAQDLLMTTNTGASSNPSAGRPNRPGSRPATDDYDSGVSPTSAEGSEGGEPSDEERLSSETAWRIAVDEAREELRAAEEEAKRQQGNAGNEAALRVTKARQRLTRLLEKGRAKQYRELPKPVELEP
jgi:hypothetical protein